MTSSITKVAHYDISLNLTQSEFEVFKSIMSNLKMSEVIGAVGSTCQDERKIVEIYDKFKCIIHTNIKVGN